MRKLYDTVLSVTTGAALQGVQVFVYQNGTGTLATIYKDKNSTPTDNPGYVTTDANGYWEFYANTQLVDLEYRYGGVSIRRITDVEINSMTADQASSATAAASSATASAASATIAQSAATASSLSANTASAAQAAVLGAISGVPAGSQLQLQALTRTALALISNRTSGLQAYLSEAGRSGVFTWNTTNLSASVTADPYQGLYVAPSSDTTGASGAWVREVRNGEYHTNWWAPDALGNNAHLALNTINGLIPATGCHVIVPPNTTYTTSATVFFKQDGVVIRGAGYSSWLQANTGVSSFHVLFIQGSHCKVLNLRLTGFETNLFAANPACVVLQNQYGQGGPAGTILQRTTDDFEVAFCNISNTSLAIVTAASTDTDGARNNGQIVVASTNIKIHHNTIVTSMHGVELFGSDYVDAHDNRIIPTPNTPAAQFSGTFRVLGSQEIDIHDNNLTGLGYGLQQHTIFYLSAADFTTGARRANKNLRFRNNDCTNSFGFMWIEECSGTLLIQGNNWKESPSSTTQTYAFFINLQGLTDGLTAVLDKIYILDNVFEGVANYITWQSAGTSTGKHLYSSGNRVIGNSWVITGAGRILNAVFPSANLYEFDEDKYLMLDGGGGVEFAFSNATGLKLRVVGCRLPASTGATTIVGGDGSGTFIKTLGNSGEDATLGSNSRYATGTFATVV